MKGLIRFFTFLFFVGLVLLTFLFAVKNTTPVSLWMGIALPEYSIGVLVIIAFIAGGLIGLVLGLGIFRQLRYRLRIRQLQGQLDKAKKASGDTNPVGRS